MRASAFKIQLVVLAAVLPAYAGCHPGSLRAGSVCEDRYSCERVIEENKDIARVQQAKARLEQIAMGTRDLDALFTFIRIVPESPRRPEAVEHYRQMLHDVVLQFVEGQRGRIKRADKVLGCSILHPGARMTLHGNLTRPDGGCNIYSWPLAPLEVRGELDGLSMISGQGVILNPTDGNAYVRGSDVF